MDKNLLAEVINMPGVGRKQIAKTFGVSESVARVLCLVRDHREDISEVLAVELIESNQKYKAEKQKFQDTNRLERKTWRDDIRLYNALNESNKELLNVFKRHSLEIKTQSHVKHNGVPMGLIVSSDLHGNELVNLSVNKYDFTIMSKRVQKHVKKTIQYYKNNGVTDIVFAMTGDMLNSDRRDDEKAVMATNRSCAQFLVSEILINAILELNQHFNVFISYVDGNESRVNKDLGFEDLIASDTYDTSIFNIIRRILKDKDGIEFDNRLGAKKIVNINGHNVLLIHGHQGFGKDPHTALTKLVAQYSKQGIAIRFVVFGHIHEAYITEMFMRSSSTVGANAFSEDGLNLTSRASQNSALIYPDGSIDGMMIDLQNTDGYDGYPIQNELEMYNAKSVSKIRGVSIYETVLSSLH
jgi:predicted phosphodiesterase